MKSAAIIFNLPSGEKWTVEPGAAFASLLRFTLAVGAGFALFGLRGATLAAILRIAK